MTLSASITEAQPAGTPKPRSSGTEREALSLLKDSALSGEEIERISKIVRDYLDSTRPIKPARVECDLARLVDEAVGIALGAAEKDQHSRAHPVSHRHLSPLG